MKPNHRDLSYDKLRFLQENSVALKLFRSDYFALTASFVYVAFKKKDREAIQELVLRNELTTYLEGLDSAVSKEFEHPAKHYIDYWISSGLLRRRYVSGQEDSSIEISYEVSKVIDFLVNLDQPGFVGTESRLAMILDTIKKLAIETDPNPEVRLEQLEKEKAELEEQISRIKETGSLTVLTDTQVKEYFSLFMEELSKLPTDFRKVTENFREITREIKSTLIEEQQRSKNSLLNDAQSANEKLETSDQGKSFNGFMNFLRSDEARVAADEHLRKVIELPLVESELKNSYGYTKANILKIWSSLYSPAQRVVESKTEFGEQIRRIVSSNNDNLEKGIVGLMNDIKSAFLRNKDRGKNNETFFSIFKGVEIYLPIERPLWTNKKQENFTNQPGARGLGPSADQLSKIFAKPSVDLEMLKRNIKTSLERRTQVTLAEVIEENPIKLGLGELMGYLKLAHMGDNVNISKENFEICSLQLMRSGRELQEFNAKIPVITFTEDSNWRYI